MAKRGSKKQINKDAWLATYGDMITLVLTFFILLYSMSTISEENWEKIVEAFDKNRSTQIVLHEEPKEGDTLPGMEGAKNGLSDTVPEVEVDDINDITELYEYLRQMVKKEGMEEDISVGLGDGFVIMRFRGNLFFGADSYVLQPEAKRILDVLSQGMAVISEQIQLVRIDGHTATNPDLSRYTISTRELSTDRANAVLEYVEGKNILDPVKLIAVGYGKYRPIASNETAEGRAENRRVEIYISDKESTDINIDEVYKALAPDGSEAP